MIEKLPPKMASFFGTPSPDGFIREDGCIPYCTVCGDWHYPDEPHTERDSAS